MCQLWFDVGKFSKRFLIRVHVCAPINPKPEILVKMLELLKADKSSSVIDLALEFPDEAEMIKLLYDIISQHQIISASGVHWRSQDGHSVQIVIRAKVFSKRILMSSLP